MRGVPKIIHQTWKTRDNLPPLYKRFHERWKRMHPDWQVWVWSDDDIEKYLRLRWPQYYDFLMSYKRPICRIDVVRYLWLYDFGGVYADMDVECVRPLDSLIDAIDDRYSIILAREPRANEITYNIGRWIVCNATMISKPRQDVWIKFVHAAERKGTSCSMPVMQTGPVLLGNELQRMVRDGVDTGVFLVPPRCFYPLTMTETPKQYDERAAEQLKVLERDPLVYTRHFWTASWWKNKKGRVDLNSNADGTTTTAAADSPPTKFPSSAPGCRSCKDGKPQTPLSPTKITFIVLGALVAAALVAVAVGTVVSSRSYLKKIRKSKKSAKSRRK